jgi:argininosuccinate lyase
MGGIAAGGAGMSRLWDRGEPLERFVLHYTAGEDHVLDERLVVYDARASAAHAAMLHTCGYLDDNDHAVLQRALEEIGSAHARGEWKITLEEEDVHSALENRLVAIAGDVGRRIHLGRSRNDQVLAALRLYLLDALGALASAADAVAAALDDLADRQGPLPMPGYTHQQQAMPTTLALWCGGYAAELRDDGEGLRSARRRAHKNPLGSAAGYGVPGIQLDREETRRALGFAAIHQPVTAVQLSRGKAEASALFEAALLGQDLGRLAAELCLFATTEFGFVLLPPELTTGSSMLPQKRNPDLFELARGRGGEAVAALNEVLSVLAKLPSGYHRDLQLIKKPLFRGLDAVGATAHLFVEALPRISFDAARLEAAIDPSSRMAERANRMVVDEGIPFREAYRRVKEKG